MLNGNRVEDIVLKPDASIRKPSLSRRG